MLYVLLDKTNESLRLKDHTQPHIFGPHINSHPRSNNTTPSKPNAEHISTINTVSPFLSVLRGYGGSLATPSLPRLLTYTPIL